MRDFLNRKKKLLGELNKASLSTNDKKRAHSPTS